MQYVSSTPATRLDVINLQTEADGVYLVTAGNGPLKDKQGRPIYLRIGGQK